MCVLDRVVVMVMLRVQLQVGITDCDELEDQLVRLVCEAPTDRQHQS
jgi:hypothetical protein